MHRMLVKAFGGLSAQYYFRHLFVGCLFPAFLLASGQQHQSQALGPLALYALIVVNTLLYPYARFVYEGVVGFFRTDGAPDEAIFLVSGLLVAFARLFGLLVKLCLAAACWMFAIFIAPLGLGYLLLTSEDTRGIRH